MDKPKWQDKLERLKKKSIESQDSYFRLEYVQADPNKGFNFPYIMLLPKYNTQSDRVKLVVECINSVDYEKDDQQSLDAQIDFALDYAEYACGIQDGKKFNMPLLYQKLNQPVIIPIIERCEYERVGVIKPNEVAEKYTELDKQGKNTEFYPQQLGRQVMLETDGKFAKLHEQIVAMVENAKKQIKLRAMKKFQIVKIDKKSALVGFSSSSVFASRLQLICPEHFDTCISLCSGGVQPLPINEYNGQQLNYPLGVADFKQLFGKEFNAKEYAKAKQISIVGGLETLNNDIAYKPRLFDKTTRELFKNAYGRVNMQQRQQMIAKILSDNEHTNIQLEVIPGIAHQTEGMGITVLRWIANNGLTSTTDNEKQNTMGV